MNSIRTLSSIIFICLTISILSSYLTFKFLNTRPENLNEVKLVHEVNNDPNVGSELLKSTPVRFLNASGTNFVHAASKSTPSVVFIESMIDHKEGIFSMPNKELSTGSGVIISPDGYIITNNHVVENAEKIQVLLNDNREYEAKLIGTDPTTDIALIKIEDSSLPYIEFGNSDSSEIGEWVLAVGNPFRLQSTVTAGIISAKARNINILNNQQYRIESFIQTDAAVNPGNSGGALVNTNGDLIGINTAIMSQTGRYEGYSFSIPANLVKKVFSDLKEFGTVQRGLLGVVIEEVNNERAKLYGLTHVGGVFISNTTRDGAADIAGLKPEDIILELNNRTIKSVPELQEIIGRLRPGSKILIKYWRNNQTNTVEAILKNQVNTTEMLSTRRDPLLLDLGFEVRDLSAEEKTNLKQTGVKVLSIYQGSIIENTNMAPGYIITTVNGKKVRSVDELIQIIQTSDVNILLEGFYEKYRGKFPYRFNKKQ